MTRVNDSQVIINGVCVILILYLYFASFIVRKLENEKRKPWIGSGKAVRISIFSKTLPFKPSLFAFLRKCQHAMAAPPPAYYCQYTTNACLFQACSSINGNMATNPWASAQALIIK